MERLSALGLVLASWAVLGLLLVGVGRLVRKALRWPSRDLGDDLWIGYAATIAALQLEHLVAPVSPVVFAAWSVAGALGLTPLGGRWWPTLARIRRGAPIGAALVVLLAYFATGSADAIYDTGLYHVSAVRWLREAPIVPGLTNLHFRLGFNNASFLWCALVDAGPWSALSVHVAQGVLFLPLLARAGDGMVTLLRARRPGRRTVYWALVAPLVFHPAFAAPAAFSPDHVVALVSLELLGRLPSASRGAAAHVRGMTYLLAALLVVVKLSGAFLAAACGALVLARARPGRREAVWLAVLLLGLVLPWAARGVVLSGCPAYPSTAMSVQVDWRVDAAAAAHELKWIRAWARGGRDDLALVHGWEWLGPWALATSRRSDVLLPLAFVVVAWIGRRRSISLPTLAPAAVGLASWLVLAPDPRFAHGLLWGVPALVAAEARWTGPDARSRARALCLLSVLFTSYCALQTREVDMTPLRPLPAPATREHRTASGLVVFVPVSGARCYDAPLPCTPAADPRLRLRDPSDPRAGFSIRPAR